MQLNTVAEDSGWEWDGRDVRLCLGEEDRTTVSMDVGGCGSGVISAWDSKQHGLRKSQQEDGEQGRLDMYVSYLVVHW